MTIKKCVFLFHSLFSPLPWPNNQITLPTTIANIISSGSSLYIVLLLLRYNNTRSGNVNRWIPSFRFTRDVYMKSLFVSQYTVCLCTLLSDLLEMKVHMICNSSCILKPLKRQPCRCSAVAESRSSDVTSSSLSPTELPCFSSQSTTRPQGHGQVCFETKPFLSSRCKPGMASLLRQPEYSRLVLVFLSEYDVERWEAASDSLYCVLHTRLREESQEQNIQQIVSTQNLALAYTV